MKYLRSLALGLLLFSVPSLANFDDDFSRLNDVFRARGVSAAMPLADKLRDQYGDPRIYAFMGMMAHSEGDVVFAYACYEYYLELSPNGLEVEQIRAFHDILKIMLIRVGYAK
jgi:hypothetical protein